jgi:hypothetical protein
MNMKIDTILFGEIDDILFTLGDNDISRLYQDSQQYFTDIVSASSSDAEIVDRCMNFFSTISGKKIRKGDLLGTREHFRSCIENSRTDEELSQSLREAMIRVTILALHYTL